MASDVDVPFAEMACAVCEQRAAEWLHHLDDARSRFRVYGKGHVWGSPVAVCKSCDDALTRGDVDVLVSRDPLSRRLSGQDLIEQARNRYAALTESTIRRESVAAATPPGWQEVLSAGFIPMERITGALHLVGGWPEQHRRSVPAHDMHDSGHSPDGQHWFIRSPWPSIDLEDLWSLVIHTIETAPGTGDSAFTEDVRQSEIATVRNLMSFDEQAILRRL